MTTERKNPFSVVLFTTIIVTALVLLVTVMPKEIPQVFEQRNPDTVVVPPLVPGAPEAPDHVRNHTRSAYTAILKVAIWNSIMNAYFGGRGPDWCGQRHDGALALYYAGMTVSTTFGKVYEGLAIIVNQGGAHMSTAFKGVTWDPSNETVPNTHRSETKNGEANSDFEGFTPINCPPPTGLGPITQ